MFDQHQKVQKTEGGWRDVDIPAHKQIRNCWNLPYNFQQEALLQAGRYQAANRINKSKSFTPYCLTPIKELYNRVPSYLCCLRVSNSIKSESLSIYWQRIISNFLHYIISFISILALRSHPHYHLKITVINYAWKLFQCQSQSWAWELEKQIFLNS